MSEVKTKFSIEDEVSDKLEAMSEAGAGLIDRFDQLMGKALDAFRVTEESASSAATNYDEAWEEAFDSAGDAAERMTNMQNSVAEAESELLSAMEEATQIMESAAEGEENAAEASEEMTEAMQRAEEALENLGNAQEEARAALENYDEVALSATADLSEMAEAEARMVEATQALQSAEEEATQATEDLGNAMKDDKEDGVDAFTAISSTLAAAGVTETIKEISEAAYELATAFSEAESTVVNATGATGEALDGLMQSTMSAFSAAKDADLSSTAGAIGEINTRMGLTGDTLTDVTGKFLDYASITGTNVVGSVQKVTKVMNQWGVEGDDVESVLDKLSYAGQVSGASVDSLSQTLITGAASFQNAGLSIDNTINMLADFELAGINSTTALTGMRTAVNNFSKNGIDASEGLQQTIERIQEMGDSSEATALAVETFGSRAGQQLALAIQNGVISAETFTSSMDEAEGTLETTAEASQTLDEKWQQANNNISAAFTNALQPTLDGISSGFAGMMNNVGTFLNENPTITKAISAIGTGVGVLVAGITGVVFITQVAIPAIASFGAAMNAALGPVGWVAMGITAATVAITAFTAMMGDADAEIQGLTASSKEQYYEVQNLNAKYEEACDIYGESSDEALRLAGEVERATEAFENNRRTLQDVIDDTNKLCDAHEEVMKSYNETNDGIRKQQLGTEDLITKLRELSSSSVKTAGAEQQMLSIVEELDEMYPELGLGIKDVNEDLDDMVDRINKVADAQNKTLEYENSKETYAKLVSEQSELEKAKEEAWDAYVEACNAFDQDNLVTQSLNSLTGSGNVALMDEAEAAYKRASAALQENIDTQEECTRVMEEYGDALEGTSEESVSAVDAVSMAINDQKEAVEAVSQAYEEAFESALSSVESQYSVWDKAKDVAATSTDDIKEALSSQIDYWEEYSDNLENLSGRNIKHQEELEAMIKSMDDGSEESAAALKGLASASDSELEKIAKKYGALQESQQETADKMADLETDYSNSLKQIESDMQDTVDKMNMEDSAKAAAESTLSGYIKGIEAMQSKAVTAAEAVAKATTDALNKGAKASPTVEGDANGTLSSANVFIAGERGRELVVPAHANGAVEAEPFYIAGEDGPELIYGQQGSTVFPHSETEKILDAIDSNSQPISTRETISEPSVQLTAEKPNTGGQSDEKRIVLEINGGGEIEVKGSTDANSILEILQENIRPVLLGMINTEIMEEADLAYDY